MMDKVSEVDKNAGKEVSEVNISEPKPAKQAKTAKSAKPAIILREKLRIAAEAFILSLGIIIGPSLVVALLPISGERVDVALAIVHTVLVQALIIWTLTRLFQLELRFKRVTVKEALEIIAISLAAIFVNLIVAYLFSLLGSFDNGKEVTSLASIDSKLVLFIFAAIVAPVTEEILFRAIPYELHKRRGTKASLVRYFIIPGIIFSLMHYDPSFTPLALLMKTTTTFSFALLTAYLYYKKENLTYNIAIHSLHNGLLVILSIIANAL